MSSVSVDTEPREQLDSHLQFPTYIKKVPSWNSRTYLYNTGLLSILVLLALRTAFDNVSHDILLDRLANIPLVWVKSYLTDSTQFVQLKNLRSSSSPVSSGVPQGCVLAPLLFTMYHLPLGHILRKFRIQFH